MSMTDAEIREALARAERATCGPWVHDDDRIVVPGTTRKGNGAPKRMKRRDVAVIAMEPNGACGNPDCCDQGYRLHLGAADGAFIAAARTDVPRLVATIRDREAEIERLRAEMRETRSRILADEERLKLTGDALTAEARCRELEAALGELADIVEGAVANRSTDDMDSFTTQPARALLSPPPSPEATPFEADTMTHEDEKCATCGGKRTVCAVPDGYHHGCVNPAHAKPCPDCGGGE